MLSNDEIKYKKTIDTLKKLQRVDAPKDFETTLMRKINQTVHEKEDGFFKRLFTPSRLVSSMALAVTAVILLFVIDLSPDKLENPLLLEPRLREDILVVSGETIAPEKLSEQKNGQRLKKETEMKSNLPSVQDMAEDEIIILSEETSEAKVDSLSGANLSLPTSQSQPAPVSNQVEFDKSRLDYRQINLNVEDKDKVKDLKEKMQNSLKKGEK